MLKSKSLFSATVKYQPNCCTVINYGVIMCHIFFWSPPLRKNIFSWSFTIFQIVVIKDGTWPGWSEARHGLARKKHGIVESWVRFGPHFYGKARHHTDEHGKSWVKLGLALSRYDPIRGLRSCLGRPSKISARPGKKHVGLVWANLIYAQDTWANLILLNYTIRVSVFNGVVDRY